MSRRPSRAVAVLVVLAVMVGVALFAGCTSGLHQPTVTSVVEPDAKGIQHVVLNAHSYWFEPNRIVVHCNIPVEIEFKNHAVWVPHNFSIASPTLKVDKGKWIGTAHIRFTPTEPDTYTFFCGVDGHSKKGMTGTLVVLP
jgi:plastocyanin domain-containing protein